MDRLATLAEEIVLHVFSFLDISDLICLQAVSHRYLDLGRDNSLWKIECFDSSRAESLRRHQQLRDAQDARLVELRDAVTAFPGRSLTTWGVSQLRESQQAQFSNDHHAKAKIQRSRAFANWEPGYPEERLDYYEEYIHRHAPINVAWFDLPRGPASNKGELREATGMGTIVDQSTGKAKHIVTPLDDGSVCIWDISHRSTVQSSRRHRLVGQSTRGLLTGRTPESSENHTIMTETGAVECVAIESNANKGYFAVQNVLHEVDLNSLRLSSSKRYPWPITALSGASLQTPVTVGTNHTVHLHDPRDSSENRSEPSSGVELIGGSIYSHATLEQPGPLSILHGNGLGSSLDSIWVAGRFTSLLNYDRRFFPRLLGTVHSGARIASLDFVQHPHIPRDLDLVRNPNASMSALQAARNASGTTILAAAEYKGKGSLELFGLPNVQVYQNRQTASASKLLSVASHGGRIVVSDGDGNVKWLERDAFSHVRTFNINSTALKGQSPAAAQEQSSSGIWSSDPANSGDIVQKMIPISPADSVTSSGDRYDVNQSNLLLWTGDGQIGVLEFGHHEIPSKDDIENARHSIIETTEQRARGDAERQYDMAMRRALERNADEVRFVRGLGMV